jgi:hypothetical protein
VITILLIPTSRQNTLRVQAASWYFSILCLTLSNPSDGMFNPPWLQKVSTCVRCCATLASLPPWSLLSADRPNLTPLFRKFYVYQVPIVPNHYVLRPRCRVDNGRFELVIQCVAISLRLPHFRSPPSFLPLTIQFIITSWKLNRILWNIA